VTTNTRGALTALLALKYEDFRRRLRRRTGSDDLAREALHEAYVQLDRTSEPAGIERPEAYLFRVVLNIAAGRRRSDSRLANQIEIEAAIDVVDEAAHAERAVEARLDLELLERAIRELPPRRKAVFLAARVEELPIAAIATSLGISRRLVEAELKKALDHCAMRLDRQIVRRFRRGEGTALFAGRYEGDKEA
jgi:RNA polymerase sigma-70 factor (ECF subfamily)